MEIPKDCAICLDSLNNNIENLPCNHKLHIQCIQKLTTSTCRSKYQCPLCRHPFKIKGNKDKNQDEDQDENQDEDQYEDEIRPSTPTSSPNPTFSLPIVQTMLFCYPDNLT